MNRTSIFAAASLAALLTACDDPGPPPPTPDRYVPPTATATASASAANSVTSTAAATALASADPAPTASATADPSASATASSSASASAAPSASSSAAPVVKGFSFPSPKSGILSPGEADKILTSGAPARIRVLDPGSDPTEKAAYAAKAGESQALRFNFGMKLGISTSGQKAPAVLVPPQTVDLDVKTESADDSGAAVAMILRSVTMEAQDGVDQDTADALTKQLTGLRGYTVREKVSSHGAAGSFKTEVPDAFPKGAEQLLSNMNGAFRAMIPRLPEEPIGTGAKWQVLSREDDSGTSLVQLADWTLKDRSGDKLTLEFKAKQLAASDVVKLPTGMPEGVTTKLSKFSTTVTGSLVIDTKQMAPIKGRSSQDAKLGIDVTAPAQAGGNTIKADVEMKMTVAITRRSGTAAPVTTSAPSSTPTSAPAPDKGKP